MVQIQTLQNLQHSIPGSALRVIYDLVLDSVYRKALVVDIPLSNSLEVI